MKINGLRLLFMILFLALMGGCVSSGGSASPGETQASSGGNAGDAVTGTTGDIASEAGGTAVDATRDNINQEVRRGVDDAFRSIFKR